MRKVLFILMLVFTAVFCVNFLNPGSPVFKVEKPIIKKPDTDNKVSHRLDSMFSKWHELNNFNGSVLIAREGKILLQKSYGLAYKEGQIPLTDTTMFQLASVSKVITATAILMLYERNLINLEKPFKEYFPDFGYEEISVKQLLNHRSGLPNYIYFLNTEIGNSTSKLNNNEMYELMCYKAPAPYLKPNKRFSYCNTNYALLALLVEKVSGISFETFLKKEIFDPLGMKNTGTIYEIDSSRIARAYNQKWKPETIDASDYILGDKSIFSTPYDLFLFSEALYQNKLLSEKTQEMAYKAYSPEQKQNNYGLGWRLKDYRDSIKKEVFHNGWWHGYRTAFHRRLKDRVTIVVFSNQLNKTVYQTYRIYEILDNKSFSEELAGLEE